MSHRHEWLKDETGVTCSQCGITESNTEPDETYDTLKEYYDV